MIKKLLFASITLLTTLINVKTSFAQHFYAGAHTSYHIGAGGSLNNYYNVESSSLSATFTQKKVNFGSGMQAGATVGYLFMKNIGLELSVNKAFTSKIELTNNFRPSWSGTYSEKINLTTSSMLFIPSLIVKSGYEKFNVYSKLGLIILKGKHNFDYSENNNGVLTEIQYDYDKINGIGFKGALGGLIKVSKSIDVQLEVNTSNVAGAPKREVITKKRENGTDKLPSMTVSEKETLFVDEYTITATPASSSEASKALKIYMPFNNVGIQLGVLYKF